MVSCWFCGAGFYPAVPIVSVPPGDSPAFCAPTGCCRRLELDFKVWDGNAWYLATDTAPAWFTNTLPYIVVLLVLVFASQRLRPPAADGRPYRKGGT